MAKTFTKVINKSFKTWTSFGKHKRTEFEFLIRRIYENVHIPKHGSKYEHIYRELDIIISTLCCYLASHSLFKDIEYERTGSVEAGVKVGYPHEADYLLDVPQNIKPLKANHARQILFKLTSLALSKDRYFCDLPNWEYLGTTEYKGIPGICINFQYSHCDEKVGVKADLVLKHTVKSTESFHLLKKAVRFLGYGRSHYVKCEEVYRLVGKSECDTGIIENNILKNLTDDQKMAFIVGKYLLHFLVTKNESVQRRNALNVDENTALALYGRKPCINSYLMRQCFIHLLICVHGTNMEGQLSNGFLVLAFLDLVHFVVSGMTVLPHPLLANQTKQLVFDTYQKKHTCLILGKIKLSLFNDKEFQDIRNYKLLNSTPNPLTILVDSTYQTKKRCSWLCCT